MLLRSHAGLVKHSPDPDLKHTCAELVPQHSLPMRLLTKRYIVNTSEFSSPIIAFLPPGYDLKRQVEMWHLLGSLSLAGDEACKGGWLRMLPCGHVYGSSASRGFSSERGTARFVRGIIVFVIRGYGLHGAGDGPINNDPRLELRWLLAKSTCSERRARFFRQLY